MNGGALWEVPGYRTVRELGSGAAGRVMLARRDHDGAEVAVKYLSDELRSDVGFVARFRHEARLLGTLRSPYNARLIDYVETGAGAAIVMELVNGVSLRRLLTSEGPTGPEAALTVLKGSLKGLAAAHAIGVVHRDFKPENVMVQGDGASKLVDFGIAARAGDAAGAAGTPPYMAPEQWSGAPAAPSTDVYAATVVFFECLTGTRPFRATNMAALARQHQSAQPPIEEVPAPLQELVRRGLAKEATERPPSAEAFLTELEAVAAEAYGAGWEERGRRRLSSLAALLLALFPNPPETPAEAQTSLAETRFPEPSRLLAKLSSKIVIGTACVGVLVGVALVAVNAFDGDTTLRAQITTVTPTTASPAAGDPGLDEPSDEPTDEPSEEPTEEPTKDPTPTAEETPTTEPTATAAPARTRTLTPTPSPRRTPKATPTPTRTRPTRTPTPTASDEPQVLATADDQDGVTTAPRPSSPPATSPQPTVSVPTRTPPSPTIEPSPSGGGGDGEGEPTIGGPTRGEPTAGDGETPLALPQERDGATGALLAAGLVTWGAVPVTLAVRRRMTGRHRRKR
ncbi:serine/threonine-protein kinase [Nonomuraea roseoviolacea]|uniref:non-specific serine/threonine protein kinase n=1 Tax=Nonomuraea roseoviolacea subsp. carminata TaxID=160689 RepID=A0ABT1K598_9ACTN|nr:serine/threonine protein kinase [Nonomuraea roseoviolacea]MCP2349186.1 serine/threonine-protein kinase [Nonomuraea roseoviolacea subsp. carminata]